MLGIPDLLLDRKEVLALDVGNFLCLGIHSNQVGLEDVLLVGLLQAVREGIDALGLIELLLRIESIIHRLHQSGRGLGRLGAQSLLRIGGQFGAVFFCIPDLLFNSQEILATLRGQSLIAGVQSNQGVLKLVLLVGHIQAVGERINALAFVNGLDA